MYHLIGIQKSKNFYQSLRYYECLFQEMLMQANQKLQASCQKVSVEIVRIIQFRTCFQWAITLCLGLTGYLFFDIEIDKNSNHTLKTDYAWGVGSYLPFNTQNRSYAIFDLLGHPSYAISNLGDVDVVVIAVSSISKESELNDHLLCARCLNAQKIIMVMSRMEDASVKWEKERVDLLTQMLSTYIIRAGFELESQVLFIPLSAFTGHNIFSKVPAEVCDWYSGPTLVEALDSIQFKKPDQAGPMRIVVLDYDNNTKTPTLAGRIFGRNGLGVGARVVIMPCKIPAVIAVIEYSPLETAKITLESLVTTEAVKRGCIICNPSNLCPTFTHILAKIKIEKLPTHMPIIAPGFICNISLHALCEECTIERIKGVKIGKDYKKAKFAKAGQRMMCIISVKNAISAEKYAVCPKLGGFWLYYESSFIIGLGKLWRYKPIPENCSNQ
eukprot:TRINITY_DN2303_c0_g1_i3.p1 TRINITY_DN2303_c0_g1~~TRINITY_DN2303_c0_g1_i3.p1  ORF type:complete len:442 (-),score=-2.50 TRINITY_DN2303_c0_g1_i3:84-1409(-)